jgi:hypothetical protein
VLRGSPSRHLAHDMQSAMQSPGSAAGVIKQPCGWRLLRCAGRVSAARAVALSHRQLPAWGGRLCGAGAYRHGRQRSDWLGGAAHISTGATASFRACTFAVMPTSPPCCACQDHELACRCSPCATWNGNDHRATFKCAEWHIAASGGDWRQQHGRPVSEPRQCLWKAATVHSLQQIYWTVNIVLTACAGRQQHWAGHCMHCLPGFSTFHCRRCVAAVGPAAIALVGCLNSGAGGSGCAAVPYVSQSFDRQCRAGAAGTSASRTPAGLRHSLLGRPLEGLLVPAGSAVCMRVLSHLAGQLTSGVSTGADANHHWLLVHGAGM